PLLGVPPALGRTFVADEDRAGASKVAVLSHALWQTRYGGDSRIVNRDIQLDGAKYTVVGVMPAGFQFMENDVRLWVPLAMEPADMANRGGHFLTVVGRLKQGVRLGQAQADLSAVMARIAKDHPDET